MAQISTEILELFYKIVIGKL